MFEECFGNGPFIFRINDAGAGPQLLAQVCIERGWREYNPETNENHWNLWWKTSGFSNGHHKNIYAFQFLNHIPKGSTICRKDNLIRYLRCMRKVYGSVYDFSPHGYNLPLEYTKLAAECSRSRPPSYRDENLRLPEEKPIWICKPVAQSQGRGIFLFKVLLLQKLSELNYDTNTIVQRYIEKPLLIGGYKFDLRLYVCVPSYQPLVVYMYKEGLARFGTDKFSLNDLKNPFRHLTNSSINKLGPGYAEMKDRVGSGCKWTLRQLRRYFQQASIPDWLIWQKITSLVVLTILSQLHQIPPTVNCFEFFGFDILIDSALRPWLLEVRLLSTTQTVATFRKFLYIVSQVNLSPALSNDCDADSLVKKPMLHDMFDLLGLPLYNTGLSIFNVWLDGTSDNDREEDFDAKMSLKGTVTILNAAGRWRRKVRRMSAHQSSYSSTSTGRARVRSSPPTNQSCLVTSSSSARRVGSYMKLPKAQLGNPTTPLTSNVPKENTVDEDLRRPGFKTWGNGRDWRRPKARDGGWVRVWPLDSEEQLDGNNNVSISGNTGLNKMGVKAMVNKIGKFNKTAKELAKKHPAASEGQLTEFLQQELAISGDLWIPPL
ncbi:hypothetical protein HUJ04_002390 [Dendroctonus ponderosae]|nr:hypothetical protein HUJ04_002390 [Dendroctonus ponderosae]